MSAMRLHLTCFDRLMGSWSLNNSNSYTYIRNAGTRVSRRKYERVTNCSVYEGPAVLEHRTTHCCLTAFAAGQVYVYVWRRHERLLQAARGNASRLWPHANCTCAEKPEKAVTRPTQAPESFNISECGELPVKLKIARILALSG